MDRESRLVVARRERGGSRMGGEFGVSCCKLLHLEWISNGILLYSTGNDVISWGRTWWEMVWEKKCVCVCIYIYIYIYIYISGMLSAHWASDTLLNTSNAKGGKTAFLPYDYASFLAVLLWGKSFSNLKMVLNDLTLFKGGTLRTSSPLKVKVDQLAWMSSAKISQEISSKYMTGEFGQDPSSENLCQSHIKKSGKE